MQKMGIVIAIGVVALLGFGIYSSNKTAQIEAKSMILYYGDTCPHCKEVEEYIKTNGLDKKLSIIQKEVYQNQGNALQLTNRAKECGLPTDQGVGVPFMWFEGKCYQGTPDIEKLLAEKAGIALPTSIPIATDSAAPTKIVN